jgi:IS5 family transposase
MLVGRRKMGKLSTAKNHVKVDTKSKFSNTYTVTDAAVHDSQALDKLLTKKDKDQDLHADSAYTGEEQEKSINTYEMKNKVHEKGYRNRLLTEKQKASNTKKSKIRARVEHVFGFMEQSMNGLVLKSVGMIRATGIIGLINLTYRELPFFWGRKWRACPMPCARPIKRPPTVWLQLNTADCC